MGGPLIYLDANVIIRLIEGAPAIRDPISQRLGKSELATSHLARLECRSKPLAAHDLMLVRAFDQFFAGQNMLL